MAHLSELIRGGKGTKREPIACAKAHRFTVNKDSEEDLEVDMLVFNAQKLNQPVKETVRAAEAASIRVR